MKLKIYTQKRLIYIILLGCLLLGASNVSATEWSQHAGGNYEGLCNSYVVGQGGEGGYDIVVDDADNTYVTGTINSDADIFGVNLIADGPWNTFVAKINSQGEVLWAKEATNPGYIANPSIDIDSNGNIFVTGYFNDTANVFGASLISNGNYDGYIAKLNSGGDLIWAHNFGGALAENPQTVFVDNLDNIYIAGNFYASGNFFGTTLTSVGDSDIFVVKLNNNGNGIWAKQAGGAELDEARDIAVDSNGGVYIVGNFSDTANLFGTSLVAGGTESWAYDIFIAKLNNLGEGQWAKRGGSDENQRDYGDVITIDDSNDLYVTGRFKEDANIFGQVLTGTTSDNAFFVKLNSAGDVNWIKHWTGTSRTYSRDLVVNNGNVYVTGGFFGTLNADSEVVTSAGSLDIYYGVLNSADGTATHLESFGASSYDGGEAIAVNSAGLVYLTGRFKESMNMFGTTLTSYGCYDVFLTKIEDNMAISIRADVDQSSSINSTDALLTLRNSLGLDMSSTNWQISATTGDVNCDGNTNSTDAFLTLRSSLGLNMGGTDWCIN